MRRGTARDDNGKILRSTFHRISGARRMLYRSDTDATTPPPLFLARIAPCAVVKKLYRISGRRWIACLRVSRSTCTCTRSCRAFLKATRRCFSTERGSGDVRMTRHESRVLSASKSVFFVRKKVRNKKKTLVNCKLQAYRPCIGLDGGNVLTLLYIISPPCQPFGHTGAFLRRAKHEQHLYPLAVWSPVVAHRHGCENKIVESSSHGSRSGRKSFNECT